MFDPPLLRNPKKKSFKIVFGLLLYCQRFRKYLHAKRQARNGHSWWNGLPNGAPPRKGLWRRGPLTNQKGPFQSSLEKPGVKTFVFKVIHAHAINFIDGFRVKTTDVSDAPFCFRQPTICLLYTSDAADE